MLYKGVLIQRNDWTGSCFATEDASVNYVVAFVTEREIFLIVNLHATAATPA